MYWPYQQSITLNLEVANLFIQTYKKFFISLTNRTKQKIPIDILHYSIKENLFIQILIELEIIILDIIELNLKKKDIQELYNQILYSLIYKTMKKLLNQANIISQNYKIDSYCTYTIRLLDENSRIFQSLFIYLIFGSKDIEHSIFQFHKIKTPKYHVKVLFENFIIQLSNIIIFTFLANTLNIQNLSRSLINDQIYRAKYKSIRNISNFQNNLLSCNWLYYYIFYPQNIYCNQYQVWLFSSKGIIYKYIYANRCYEYLKLSPSQMSAIIYLELQDFIIPKINFLTALLGKLIIYTLIEIINKSFQTLLNQIIMRFNNYKK